MNDRSKIRLVGDRGSRFLKRIGIHFGMMALYLPFFGLVSPMGMLLWVAFAVGLVALFFLKRQERRIHREYQISSEVIELFPDRSADELHAAYMIRRGQEMRTEALLYLCLAGASALWILLLYVGGANPLSWILGFLGIVPCLLLVALGLLIGSFMNRKEPNMPTLDAYLADPERQRIMVERRKRPNHRRETAPVVILAEGGQPQWDLPSLIKKQVRIEGTTPGMIALYVFAFVFFVVLPNLGLLFTLLLLGSQELSYLPILFAVVCVPCDAALAVLLRRRRQNQREKARKLKLLSQAYTVQKDRILSTLRNENEAFTTEVCFDRAGTFKVKGPSLQKVLLSSADAESLLLVDKDEVLGIVFSTGEAESAPQPLESSAPSSQKQLAADNAPVETVVQPQLDPSTQRVTALTSEQVAEKAAMRLSAMDPARRKEWEEEILRTFETDDRLANKKIDNRTAAETAEFHQSLSVYLQRASAMSYDLAATEQQVTESLHVSREQIAQMKKNPYVPGFLLSLAAAVVIGVGGNLLAALIARNSGSEMTFLHVIASTVSGLLALRVAERLMAIFRFRKLQKVYRTPEFWDRLVDAEAYRMLSEQLKSQRQRNGASS